jgi:hypothetical protein
MRLCCQIQETRLRKNIGKSVELGRSLRFFTIQRITAYHLASPRRVSNAIMYFIGLESNIPEESIPHAGLVLQLYD